MGNRGLEALDVLAERIVAIHVAFKFRKGTKPNWELASALEERPARRRLGSTGDVRGPGK